ncbi:MAG: phosphoribosyltransferase regulatory subunit, partial [Solirubrobacteraceae bacterium]|nr:phosphoribosyltransferase regulatory subunit [Solirubrobacteraceae bacterium]
DFVGVEREAHELGLGPDDTDLLVRVPQLRGGPDVLAAPAGPVADAVAGLRSVLDLLEPAVAGRVIFDLGLSRGLGYYTGAVFDVYDPALGEPLGGGGRYDDLLARFGRPLPAVGFAIGVDRLHAALAGEGR